MPLASVCHGEVLSAEFINAMVDKLNSLSEIVEASAGKCEYCHRYGPLGSCLGCGAANRPVSAPRMPRLE
jgi:hypothetical protein